MTAIHAPDVTDKFATRLIRRTAKELMSDGVFPRSELEDVIQDLRLALIAQARNFDPDKARWSTFVRHVVEQSAISLRRRNGAQCRQAASDVSTLNVPIQDEDGDLVEFGATVSEEEYRTGVGLASVSHTDQIDLALDVQNVMDSLPEELRVICERLNYRTPTEVRRELGITRTTMQRRMAALREHFEAAGIGEAA